MEKYTFTESAALAFSWLFSSFLFFLAFFILLKALQEVVHIFKNSNAPLTFFCGDHMTYQDDCDILFLLSSLSFCRWHYFSSALNQD